LFGSRRACARQPLTAQCGRFRIVQSEGPVMNHFWCVAGVLAVAWLALGTRAEAADFPTGTYIHSLHKETVIRFDEDGKFKVTLSKLVVAKGTYTVTGDEVTLTDEDGGFAEKEPDRKVGKYRWKVKDKVATFTPVEDRSKGWRGCLTTGTWFAPK
jgi:hypothetical protein